MFLEDADLWWRRQTILKISVGDPADCFICFFLHVFFLVCCLPPAQACAIISSKFCIQRYAAPWPPRAISQIFRSFNTLQCVIIIDHPTRDWFGSATLWPGLSANNGQITRKHETRNWLVLIRPPSLQAVRMLNYSSHRIPMWTTWRTLTDPKTKFLSVCIRMLQLPRPLPIFSTFSK